MGECEICVVQTIESQGAAEDTVKVFEQLDALFDPHVNRRGYRDGSLHVSSEDFSLLAVEFYPSRCSTDRRFQHRRTGVSVWVVRCTDWP